LYKDEVVPSITKEKFLKAISEIYTSIYGIDKPGQGDGGAYHDLLKSLKLDGENIRFKPPGSETARARHQLHKTEPTHADQ
jgi:hypothetical protein